NSNAFGQRLPCDRLARLIQKAFALTGKSVAVYLLQTSMPSTESRIPESAPARLLLAPAVTFEPGLPEAEFRKIFPQAFRVRAVDLYEAKKKNMGDGNRGRQRTDSPWPT